MISRPSLFRARPPRRLPRRNRRALGLFSQILGMVVLAVGVSYGLRIFDAYAVEQQGTTELKQLDAAAIAARGWVLKNFAAELAAATTPQQISVAALQEAGFWPPTTPTVTSRRRPIEIWAYAPNGGANGVLVFAVAAGAASPPTIPAGDPATGPTGWINPLRPTYLSGPGVSYDMTPLIQAAPNAFVPDAAAAVRYVSISADAEPYLYRKAVPGHPELNQMQTGLDLGGQSITNIDKLQADTMALSGALTSASATVSGPASISGTVYADTVNVTGELSAGTASINDQVSAQTADIGTVTASSGNFTALTAQDADVTGTGVFKSATATTLSATTLSANNMTFNTLSVTNMLANQAIGSTLQATTGLITNLTTQSCTGC